VAWLRVDDGFATHPKIAQLSDSEFRVWMRVLCYCARYQSAEVGAGAGTELRGLTAKARQRFTELGLLDNRNGSAPVVHNWKLYTSASTEEKVLAYLADHPDASANKVAEQVPGQRKQVLELVKKLREGGS
jgi:hypothetical protein